jgi:hypothetical protein
MLAIAEEITVKEESSPLERAYRAKSSDWSWVFKFSSAASLTASSELVFSHRQLDFSLLLLNHRDVKSS